MIYKNNDINALYGMERDRLGGYDCYDEDIKECPVCGALYPEKFYIDDDEECLGCNICVSEVEELY